MERGCLSLPDYYDAVLIRLRETIVSGFVYFIYDERNHLTKIGKTKRLRERCENLMRKNRREMIFLFAFDLKNCHCDRHRLELYLHKFFESKRVSGEWFNLSRKDIFDILRLSSKIRCKIIQELVEGHGVKEHIRSFKKDIKRSPH